MHSHLWDGSLLSLTSSISEQDHGDPWSGSEPIDVELIDDSPWETQHNVPSGEDYEELELETLGGHVASLARKVNSFILGTYPTSLETKVVQQALSYRLSVMTPRVLPATNSLNPYLQYWLPLSMSDKAVFSALLSASLSHQIINHLLDGGVFPSLRDNEAQLQVSFKETVSAINDSLRDLNRATSDATILAVLMAVEKPDVEIDRPWSRESPFHAPLQGLQWLKVHSAREPNVAHQDGLCRIIELRGGLFNIQMPGVAAAAFYRVLVNSTLLLTKPALPFYPLSGASIQSLTTYTIEGPAAEARMNILDEAGLNSDITCSLYELAAYTASIESYVRGDTLRLDAQVMCDRRNLAQYNLMCIAPQTGMQQESALSEITRIAAVIYSVGVTFPLAGVGAPFSKLAKLLKHEIADSRILELASFRESTRCLLLWALVMGGITAEESDKAWYITVLADLIRQYQLTDWRKLKESLKMILWLDSACDMAGKELEIVPMCALQGEESQMWQRKTL
ncbi:hypothetical protein N7452_001672 [Penicillium brevicompactum]|uniref:Uncharacterized protein n=1 Tax=Penicillium brevicompactum TaxID=5074 RepID=A0A9W9R2T7_PENBR|nr:hypothetical protein N7452_001672 [Penicillium brevicompactum]